MTLKTGVTHVDRHAHEASVLATVSAPTKAGYTTTARVKVAARRADLLNAIAWL